MALPLMAMLLHTCARGLHLSPLFLLVRSSERAQAQREMGKGLLGLHAGELCVILEPAPRRAPVAQAMNPDDR